MRPIIFNGKFYSGALNGVHRVADRLIREADRLLDAMPPGSAPEARLLVPRRRDWTPALSRIRLEEQALGHCQIWEQLALPWKARGAVLVNLCNLAPLLARRRILLLHDAQFMFSDSSYPPRQRWGHRLLAPAMMRGSAVPLTVSQYSREVIDLTGVCPRERVGVVHNGVDHMLDLAAAPDALAKWGLVPRGYVLMFGSAKRYKNTEIVFRAFAGAGLRGLKLAIVGEDGRAGTAATPNAVCVGKVSDSVLRTLYEHAICLATPSRTEGFGLPPLEAMQLGCPSVVAPAGAMPEMCRDAVCYADPDDPAEWVAAIRALQGDERLRAAKVAAGLSRAQTLTWARAGAQLLNHALALAGAAAVAHEPIAKPALPASRRPVPA